MAARHCPDCETHHELSITHCPFCGTRTVYAADLFPDLAMPSTEWAKVETWRLKVLVEDAGYPVELAERLARRRDVDLHQAADLIKKGCEPELAAAILL